MRCMQLTGKRCRLWNGHPHYRPGISDQRETIITELWTHCHPPIYNLLNIPQTLPIMLKSLTYTRLRTITTPAFFSRPLLFYLSLCHLHVITCIKVLPLPVDHPPWGPPEWSQNVLIILKNFPFLAGVVYTGTSISSLWGMYSFEDQSTWTWLSTWKHQNHFPHAH